MQLVTFKPIRGESIKFARLKEEFKRAYDDYKRSVENNINTTSIGSPVLSKPDSNTKLAKQTDRTTGYKLFSLFLAPSGSSGYNTCPWASDECIKLCLNTSGRGAMNSVQEARIKKTKRMVESPYSFMRDMLSEMHKAMKSATKSNNKLAIRLNGTSDIPWEHNASFIESFCEGGSYLDPILGTENLVKFKLYDYTKSYTRVTTKPSWYDMTLSYSGHNWIECERILKSKIGRVAMVFYEKIPDEYKGYEVVRGDDDDYRFLDKTGVIVGLLYKSVGKEKDHAVGSFSSDFVIKL